MAARRGFSLLELLVVLSVVAVLVGLLLPAVQRVRGAADRAACAHRLRQLALALHQYEGVHGAFPPAVETAPAARFRYLSWQARLLPHLEQGPLWETAAAAFAAGRYFTDDPPHAGLSTALPAVACPADGVARQPAAFAPGGGPTYRVGLTSYLGVNGTRTTAGNGVLYQNSRTRIADIPDGTSSTLVVGERPAPAGGQFGWWYGGSGAYGTGALDSHLGVREYPVAYPGVIACPYAPGWFGPGRADDPCAAVRFWSAHDGGAHFALADGAVRFLRYEADGVLPALATRGGGEVAGVPE